MGLMLWRRPTESSRGGWWEGRRGPGPSFCRVVRSSLPEDAKVKRIRQLWRDRRRRGQEMAKCRQHVFWAKGVEVTFLPLRLCLLFCTIRCGLPQCSFSLWVPIYSLSIVVKTNRTGNSIETTRNTETILALWPWAKEELKESKCGCSTVMERERPVMVRKLPPKGLWPLF